MLQIVTIYYYCSVKYTFHGPTTVATSYQTLECNYFYAFQIYSQRTSSTSNSDTNILAIRTK